MVRKSFTTTIDAELQQQFKEKCSINKDKMNDVLETFMKAYINDEIKLEVQYKLNKIK
ncbi:hypothetical protein [Clostridium botulinum]|uniref:hypothetical protein n=1 Tax=Clostridium botulinum TaxID=1491 RepID=UPI000B2646D3|nr:hypothetical protein [Clostridium botulinum]